MKRKTALISLSIYIFCVFWWNNTFASDRSQAAILKDIILKKREIENNNSKWNIYIQALDWFFKKNKNSNEKINDIINKVSVAKLRLWNNQKDQEIKLLIEYIEYKAELLNIKVSNNSSTNNSVNNCWYLWELPQNIFNNPSLADEIGELSCMWKSILNFCQESEIEIDNTYFKIEKKWDNCMVQINMLWNITECKIIDTFDWKTIYSQKEKNTWQYFFWITTESFFWEQNLIQNCS